MCAPRARRKCWEMNQDDVVLKGGVRCGYVSAGCFVCDEKRNIWAREDK